MFQSTGSKMLVGAGAKGDFHRCAIFDKPLCHEDQIVAYFSYGERDESFTPRHTIGLPVPASNFSSRPVLPPGSDRRR